MKWGLFAGAEIGRGERSSCTGRRLGGATDAVRKCPYSCKNEDVFSVIQTTNCKHYMLIHTLRKCSYKVKILAHSLSYFFQIINT
jgi:hypothetical protein